jgi:hypothetical protein
MSERIITFLIFLGLLLCLLSCSSAWHLRQAIKKGGRVKSDTVYQEVTTIVPAVTTDTIFKESYDTVTIEKERLKIKYVKLPGDSVYIQGECEADTITQTVTHYVTQTITAPSARLKFWHWLVIILVLLTVVGWAWRR